MIHVIQAVDFDRHADLLRQMHRMRARVFGGRLGWDVHCAHGEERDELDGASPVYLVHTSSENVVDGSCRLLPTTGPTLMERCFVDTMPDVAHLSSPSIWECTRFCVEHTAVEVRDSRVSRVTLSLIQTIVRVSAESGIDSILANFDLRTMRICRKAGFRVEPLGVTHRFERPVYLGSFSIKDSADALGSLYSGVTLKKDLDLSVRSQSQDVDARYSA